MEFGFLLGGCWIWVVRMLNFDCMHVGFWLCGRKSLIAWTLNYGWFDEFWILVVWTLFFGCVDAGIWLFGRWILVGWMVNFGCVHVGV